MPLNRFKPSSKIFYWPFQGCTSFVDLLCFCSVLCLLCFVRVCLYVLCGHLLGKGWPLGSRLCCLLWVCHFPIGILGQVWYLIVSFPDLCNLTYFACWRALMWANEQRDMEGRCRPWWDLFKKCLKSPASNTAYLTLRSSHCRSTCRPAHMTPNFLFFAWRKLAVILNSAVYHIAMTTCKSTRQDLLLKSIQNFVCCSPLWSRLRTDFSRHFVHKYLIILSPCMTTE